MIGLNADDLPDGVAVRPEPPRGAFGNDRNAGIRSALRLRETAPSDEIDVEQLEVFRRYELVVDRHASPRFCGVGPVCVSADASAKTEASACALGDDAATRNH